MSTNTAHHVFRRDPSLRGERSPRRAPVAAKRRGVVLIAVLVVVVLLSLAAYQYAELMTSEYKAADGSARATQARALAASGVYYAAAMLSDPDTFSGTLNSNPYDNSSIFQGVAVGTGDNPRQQGRFSVIAPYGPDESASDASTFRYGATDESGKVNLNALIKLDPTGQVAHDLLMKLPNMTEEVADAIIDWIDPDDDPRPNGAESQYYTGLSPGYQCKNGPLDSLEELLLVRGVTPDLLFGVDRNRNGVQDPDEPESSSQTAGGGADRGWSAYLTVYSRERNVAADGTPRIYLNDPDLNTLYTNLTTALGDTQLADFILAYRLYGQYTPQPPAPSRGDGPPIPVIVTNSPSPVAKAQLDMSRRPQSIPSLFGLVGAKVGITRQGSASQTTTVAGGRGGTSVTVRTSVTPTVTTVYSSPLADQSKLAQLLPVLLDKCTTNKATELPARVNVNTAPQAVLAALPGLEDTDVQAILAVRPAPGSPDLAGQDFQTPAWLLTEVKLPATTLQALERYLTAGTQVYRVQSLGYFDQGGPTARVEAVIDTNGGNPRIVYWRDLSELGKGFDIQK
jgi:type II secretory pathway component PulK